MTAAVSPIVAVGDIPSDQCGSMTYWSLSGRLDHARLRAEWEARGLGVEHLPLPASPETAFRLACQAERGKHRLVRPLEDGVYAIVDEAIAGADWQAGIVARLVLGTDGQVAELHRDGGVTVRSPLGDRVQTTYEERLTQLSDDGTWFVRRVMARGSVRLRESGGFYFVPRAAVGRWSLEVEAIRAASGHTIYQIPALRSDEAVAAIVAAVLAEAEAAANDLIEDLARDDLGERALESRAAKAEKVAAKVRAYEELLGQGLGGITEKLMDLSAGLSQAALAVAAKAEENSK